QDLAAARRRRGRAILEIFVEELQQFPRRQGFGQLREAAQVGVPERRLDAVAVAALHLAVQDAFADARADEGVEQAQRHAARLDQLDLRREEVGQRLE